MLIGRPIFFAKYPAYTSPKFPVGTEKFIGSSLSSIKKVYDKFDIVLDPHSAIGYGAFDKVNLSGNNIVLATAHPCKFPDAIKNAINLNAELPKELKYILNEKENYKIIDNNIDEVKKHIKERI